MDRESDRALAVARDSGLIGAGRPLLVLVSGGADSVCLLDVAVRLGAEASALHVNYGLRPEAGADEAHCAELCSALGVPLIVERADLTGGENLQAEARRVRYAHAERHAVEDYAAAHTTSDQAETILYRLAVSPGRRALLGMAPRRGRLVRPLLGATRADTRAYCRARGLAWREDASNKDPRFARARVREEVLPVLRALNPAAEQAIAETGYVLRDEAEVLERAVDEALERSGGALLAQAELRREPPALARLMLRRAAEVAAGRPHSLSRAQADAVLALGEGGGSASLDLGGGLRAVAEYGVVRFTLDADAEPPEPATLAVPGAVRFGPWQVEARLGAEGDALLDGAELAQTLVVRSWRAGDRMRPAGLGGTKSLQDLFTDRKVPRALRRSLPVVESDGEIAWVAGVAVAERFRARVEPGAEPTDRPPSVVSLSAQQSGARPPPGSGRPPHCP